MSNRFGKILQMLQKPLVVVYSVLVFVWMMKQDPGIGDESLFLSDLNLIQQKGWEFAIAKSISIPYMLLSYPFSLFLENHIALRITNILLLGVLFFYFWKRNVRNGLYWDLLFFVPALGYFFMGTNDGLFFLGLIIYFYEVYLLIKGENAKITLAVLALLVSFFTRELIVVFVPAILLGFWVVYRKKKFDEIQLKYVFPVFVVFLLLNIPSIKTSHKLSYDLKAPPSNEVTWAQRQYLAQLMVNEGVLENHQHPSWETTIEYLKQHGENSLPKGVFDGIFFDFGLTVKEFFKDFAEVCFYGFRQMSLMFFFPFLAIFLNFKNKKLSIENLFIPLIYLLMICIFSFIIISYVELRWLSPVFVLAILYYSDRNVEEPIIKKYSLMNTVLIICICFYGGVRLYPKMGF